ncbi:MAG: chaperone NapD [Burkholderiales bacterium]|nr:chaperone NapD [Burkholderiales bacterium]
MKVASLVVRARPERVEALRAEIGALPGTEVHAVQPEGRLIVTVDDCDGTSPAENIVKVHNLGGVIGVSLVYEYCDDEIATEERTS